MFVPGATLHFHFCSCLGFPLLVLVKPSHPTSSAELQFATCFIEGWILLATYIMSEFLSNYINPSMCKSVLSLHPQNTKLSKFRKEKKVCVFFLPEVVHSLLYTSAVIHWPYFTKWINISTRKEFCMLSQWFSKIFFFVVWWLLTSNSVINKLYKGTELSIWRWHDKLCLLRYLTKKTRQKLSKKENGSEHHPLIIVQIQNKK